LPTASEVIRLEGVSKEFRRQKGRTLRELVACLMAGQPFWEPFYALRDVTISVAKGETLGIIGRNGSGKSTILKIIAGVTAPTGGRVYVRGRVSPLIELGAGFHPDLTGRENVFMNASILGMSNAQIRERFQDIVSFAELWDFIDMPVKRYSSGMYVRLGFAVAVHCEPDILLVDEVLAVGDLAFQEKCLQKMREFQERGVTIVLVTHSLDMVQEFCHRVIWLDEGRVRAEGPPEAVIPLYREAVLGHQMAQEAHLQPPFGP
jgi:ABC-type polysaccharide/polyol phosphate transport system ATPase subunit